MENNHPNDIHNATSAADKEAQFEEKMEHLDRMPPLYSSAYDPFAVRRPKKSKFVACLFAFLFPGTGHFYLGLMQRGLFMMLLFILDIYAIVHNAIGVSGESNVPLVTLFGLLVPVVYFYNVFDALQSADQVNKSRDQAGGLPPDFSEADESYTPRGGKKEHLGWILIAVGAIIFLVGNKPAWLNQLIDSAGSYVGALVLILAGVLLFLKDMRK